MTVVGFVVGIALMASSGVQVLIPETGQQGLVDGISAIGFLAFFVFLASLGVALLRRPPSAAVVEAPAVPVA